MRVVYWRQPSPTRIEPSMIKTVSIRTAFLLSLAGCGGSEPQSVGEGGTAGSPQPPQAPNAASPGVAPAVSAPRAAQGSGRLGDSSESGTPSATDQGCGKVDFLFVVDNSLSMLAEQQALASSFPGFMDVVESTLEARDFHIMVVDTDAASPGAELSALLDSLLGNGGSPGASNSSDPCASTLGAGRRRGSEGADCGLPASRSFLDGSQGDLADSFSCVAQVGVDGSPREAPAAALLASLSPELNAAGGCNDGFLRDDAVLVVTVIGDEDDTVSPGEPDAWFEALVDLKAGDEQSVVFLGLVGGGSGESTCEDGPIVAPRLVELAERFTFGSASSVCAIDFAPFFESSVSVIDTACDTYVAPVLR